ncbi:MBL fold metallo-hydrolase [Paracoccus sp. (in: a-proteobacteria)]|uniref:MBL fold metallo-hydrolase n=1 Tax=Paracoccus sp. TaxID=267 RepID=UPI002AFE7A66|nr:MBL fold metallo-hydrolase [Paracoccus sp. (in: a-proteobacteria)]
MLCLTTLRIGECRAPAWGAGLRGRGFATFPALVTLIRTETATVLVDGGYGPAFFKATARFPARFYRWLTPVRLPKDQWLSRQLPCVPDMVLLTHMHADHVSGLMELPEGVPVRASRQAIAHLRGLSDWQALRAACPAGLRNAVLARDPQPVEDAPLVPTGLPGFPEGHDILDDGRLIAIPLPGHGIGQIGLWIPEAARFLIADAAYGRASLRENRLPPGPVLARLGDGEAYRDTFARLRALMHRRPEIIFDPSHCPETAP